MSHPNINKKVKLIIGSISIIMISVVLTACGRSYQYDNKKPVGKQLSKTITGVEAGGGQMINTQKAMSKYGLSAKGWQLQASSTSAMASQLNRAYRHKHPIVVTAWTPHWIFNKYKLKVLKDPKHVFGQGEHIDAVTRKNFKNDNPGAYKLLSQFHWSPKNMSDVLMKINGGQAPEKAAQEYINDNPKLFKKWTKDVPKGNGKKVRLVNVSWDSEIASTNVVAQALNKLGYKTTIQTLEPQPMFLSLAKGASDASVSIWLPTTHGEYFNQYKNQIDDAGSTLEGAQTGLVVPKYMTKVNSIEDLSNK